MMKKLYIMGLKSGKNWPLARVIDCILENRSPWTKLTPSF